MMVEIQARVADCMLCHGENYAAEISGWVMLEHAPWE